MLKAHMDAMERVLLTTSQVPANSGHSLHKGTPREAFIREFLEAHLSERIAIGTGEIIGATSRPNERRPQIDIVLYKRNYPKLDFGGGVSGFLAESVVATIEVKSLLDEAAISQSITTAATVKALPRHVFTSFIAGYQPPSILSFVVAYEGPASMNTVYDWIAKTHAQRGISSPTMPPSFLERIKIAAPSIDAVFLLGRGYLHFDNIALSIIKDEQRMANPNFRWVVCDKSDGNLLFLFLLLTEAIGGVEGARLDPRPYVGHLGRTQFTIYE